MDMRALKTLYKAQKEISWLIVDEVTDTNGLTYKPDEYRELHDISVKSVEDLTEVEKALYDEIVGGVEEERELSYKHDYGTIKVRVRLVPYRENINGYVIEVVNKRPFRKAEKKQEQERAIATLMPIAQSVAKDLKAKKEAHEKFLSTIKKIRESVFIATRKLGMTLDEFVKVVELYIAYNEADDKVEFLKTHGFKGIENFGINRREDDGFGHQNVTYSDIDFAKRTIEIKHGNSSD